MKGGKGGRCSGDTPADDVYEALPHVSWMQNEALAIRRST